ncbi:hypothetical protein L7F22_045923, partial [Adiantum nelumboides]|nr:hypothetical protein [Adiantum nelumboides]
MFSWKDRDAGTRSAKVKGCDSRLRLTGFAADSLDVALGGGREPCHGWWRARLHSVQSLGCLEELHAAKREWMQRSPPSAQ